MKKKYWTEQEYEYLEKNWGKQSIPQIAKALGRSNNAVKVKIVRKGLGRAELNSDCLNARQASSLLGIDVHAITDYWIPKCGLKAKYIAPSGVRKRCFIKVDDLLKWLKNNQDKWDSRKVELFALGTEPDWLKQKRAADRIKPKNKAKKWTAQDDVMLKKYYYDYGYSRVQIAELMERSPSAIDHRLLRLIRN